MNRPRIENSDRGLTINKTLAWGMIVVVVGWIAGTFGFGLWLGGELSAYKTSFDSWRTSQTERNDIATTFRHDITTRVQALEISRAIGGVTVDTLNKEIATLREEMKILAAKIDILNSRLMGGSR